MANQTLQLNVSDVMKSDEDIARYSVLHDNNRLFMSKYLTYLPTKE